MISNWNLPRLMVALAVLIAVLAAPALVFAGGWAVITLDRLPSDVTAGQPYPIGFMARQHGKTPLEMPELRIEARQVERGQTLTFTARPDGVPGHYQAELLFPEGGRWEWGISSGLYPETQPMPALNVTTSAAAAPAPGNSSAGLAGLIGASGAPALALGILALLAFAGGVALLARGQGLRWRWLAGTGLLALFAVLAFASYSSASAQVRQEKPVPVSGAVESTGRQLFLAKGCVVCHTNDRAIQVSEAYGVNVGPNLTIYRKDPEYLHSFLKDPQSTKPGVQMPNLELRLEEIEALIAFLNGEDPPGGGTR